MKTIQTPFLRQASVLVAAILVAGTLNFSTARALSNPINPDGPTPNAGVAPGHRAAGAFTARRPGNIPKYGPQRQHSYTGVTKDTP
jgi:hypothetical protein